MQRFLGALNYDRIFISNIARLTSVLYEILKKDKKFEWNENSESAFQAIKKEWGKVLELNLPDFDESYVLETDASDIGLGAVLKQKNITKAFISRSLKGAEKNYTITEREVLASLCAMEKFQFYLIGKEFELITDHKAMIELKKKLVFGSKRIIRWFERLEQFNFKVSYRKGEEMVQADALSRSVENNGDFGESD